MTDAAMTYETVQALAHFVASMLFVAVLAGVAFHAFRPANKQAFEHAARLPLDSNNLDQKR